MDDSPTLLEREGLLAATKQCLDRARTGTGAALFIVGDSGLGKTALLEAAAALAAPDMDVAFGRGDVMERAMPFGLLEQALTSLDPEGGRAIARAEPVAEPTVPYYHVLRWIERRNDRPFLLALDDLHWADEDSLRMAAFIARRANWLPVAVIGTLRPWPDTAERVCAGLADAGYARIERLEPLGVESVAELLAASAGESVSADVARRAWELCGGNPLLVEQLGAGLARGERVPNLGDRSQAFGEHLLLARFAGLDDNAWRFARAASVLGTRFRFEVAAELAGLDDAAGVAALEPLLRGGLVVEDDATWARFVHPLFGQALYEDISVAARRRLHARAFSLLLERGLDARAAEHAVRAELAGDERALDVLERTGRAALAGGAVATAADNLAAAVRFSGERVRVGLGLAFAEALTANGRMDRAAATCRKLLDREDMSWQQRIEALRIVGRAEYLMGARDYGERALARAAEIAIEHDPVAAVQPLLDQSLSAWLDGGPKRALGLAERARELAAGADADLRERADATWGHVALEHGDPAGLAATAPLARHLRGTGRGGAFAVSELTWPWASIYQFGMSAVHAEHFDDAERAFRLARAAAEESGAANALANVAIHLANVLIRRGRLEEALAEAIRARELSDLTPAVLPYAELVEAEAMLWLGRLGDSGEMLGRAEERAPGQWFVRLWAAHLQGLRLLWGGDAAASDQFLIAERLTNEVGIAEPCNTLWAGHAIDAHLAAGHPERAESVLGWLERCAGPLVCEWPRIQVEVGRARMAWHGGDGDGAAASFERALAMHDGHELPLSRIQTLLAYGRFLRVHARSVDARRPIADALREAEAIGAGWLASSAADELRLAGGKRRRGPEERDALTEAERRVAELAAGGHSNADIARRLYLSVNTVQTHLKHVYRKLGISSRRQLMILERDGAKGPRERSSIRSN